MIWDEQKWNSGRRAFYQQCIRLRLSSSALLHGGFQILYAAHETLAFMREAPEERLIIVARRAPDGLEAIPVRHGGLSDGIVLQEVFSGEETVLDSGILSLSNLPDAGIQVWRSTISRL